MTPPDYEYLRKFLKDNSGLDLSADKHYLIESRLLPVARNAVCPGICRTRSEIKERVDPDRQPGDRGDDHQRDVLLPRQGRSIISAIPSCPRSCRRARPARHPDLVRRRLDRAGAVFAGDVPEGNGARSPAGGSRSWRPICREEVLEKSKAGLTASSRSSAACRSRCWSNISSRSANLADQCRHTRDGPASAAQSAARLLPARHFDVIFCRNVLIYFDQDTKINIFRRLAKSIERDGFLALGAAKTAVGLTDVFKPYRERRGLYRPEGFDPASTKTRRPVSMRRRPLQWRVCDHVRRKEGHRNG